MTREELQHRFMHHPPTDDKGERLTEVRKLLLETAVAINKLTPTCREQSLAFTHLEETMFWANAAIARS